MNNSILYNWKQVAEMLQKVPAESKSQYVHFKEKFLSFLTNNRNVDLGRTKLDYFNNKYSKESFLQSYRKRAFLYMYKY